MTAAHTLYIVEDAEATALLLQAAFAKDYQVQLFGSAEACLEALSADDKVPDVFVLDVDLPGMDGYTLCRKLKQHPTWATASVLFTSALDDLESRLEGYDAGGTDYITKPYNLVELRQKISALLRSFSRSAVPTPANGEIDTLTTMVLANLDEYAILIRFLRALNDSHDLRYVVADLLHLLHDYHLDGVAQIRLPGLELTVSDRGQNLPLEISVLEHVRKMDRIFEFKTRAAFNFEHLTLLVNNMPVQDPDRCGRLRDHLAIAVECAEARLLAIQAQAENAHARESASSLLEDLRGVVEEFTQRYNQARYKASSLTADRLDAMRQAFAALALSEIQEEELENIVRGIADELAAVYDFSGQTQQAIENISTRLQALFSPAMHLPPPEPEPSETPLPSIELF